MDTSNETRMNITEDNLPSTFENEIVENGDEVIVKSNVKTMEDIKRWVKSFGMLTDTKWNSRSSRTAGNKFVCWKKFVCQHSSFCKVSHSSKSAACRASVCIKIKLNTMHTRNRDPFVRRGLVGVVTITPFHKHSLMTRETLRFLPAEPCRERFDSYFNDGLGPAAAKKQHEEDLKTKTEFNEYNLANSRINPTQRTISYWYERWRLRNPGVRNRDGRFKSLEKKSEVVIGTEPDSDLGLEPEIMMTTVTPSDMVVEMDSTTLITPDIDPPDLSSPGPSSRMEPDSSMTEQDVFLALTCEVYPVDDSEPVVYLTKIKEEPIDTDEYKQDILSATVLQELTCVSKESSVISSQVCSLLQPPVLIKEEPVSSEEEL